MHTVLFYVTPLAVCANSTRCAHRFILFNTNVKAHRYTLFNTFKNCSCFFFFPLWVSSDGGVDDLDLMTLLFFATITLVLFLKADYFTGAIFSVKNEDWERERIRNNGKTWDERKRKKNKAKMGNIGLDVMTWI